MTPDESPPHQKPPAVKPTLQDLAIIPLQESQWYMLGKALGLHESLLDSIRMGGYNPTRCKREMFKNWLKVKSESVSWQSLLIALREMGATDVATTVQKEYGISSSSDTEEVQDEVDAGFVEVSILSFLINLNPNSCCVLLVLCLPLSADTQIKSSLRIRYLICISAEYVEGLDDQLCMWKV